jgi:hypothetical protein
MAGDGAIETPPGRTKSLAGGDELPLQPTHALSYAHGMSSTLELTLVFHFLAAKPSVRRWGRRWDTHVVVDGKDHVFEEGPSHSLSVEPGQHTVDVFFTGAGLQALAGALGIRYGRRSIELQVNEGRTAHIHYKGGMFWGAGGGKLSLKS